MWLKLDGRSAPRIVSRPGTGKRMRHIAPSLASVTAGAASPNIQQPLARRVDAKESKDHAPLCGSHTVTTADQFIVRHAAIGQDNGSPRPHPYVRAEWKPRPEHQRVEQIAFKSNIGRYRAIIERARQGRNKINLAGRPAFDEATAGNLDNDIQLHLRTRDYRVVINGPVVVCVFHIASLPQSDRLAS
jgi:hypothetical protein